jgi:hypothetical protein
LADQDTLQPAANGFDFGKLGHSKSSSDGVLEQW